MLLRTAEDAADLVTERGERIAPGLGWSEFMRRYYPGRRRHDLEALEAYAAYRSKSESRKGATS